MGIGLMIVLFLMFGPSTCNGVTYYRGIRGCSSGGKTGWEGPESDWKHGSILGGLINW